MVSSAFTETWCQNLGSVENDFTGLPVVFLPQILDFCKKIIKVFV